MPSPIQHWKYSQQVTKQTLDTFGITPNVTLTNQLAHIEVNASAAHISGGKVPALSKPELEAKVNELIDNVHTLSSATDHIRPLQFHFLVKSVDFLWTAQLATSFVSRVQAELKQDLAKDWIKDSPHAETLTMGNLVDV
jgi:hypothetical protein